ncbi:MAG: alpha-1,2-fucosyltransferase [bacterium]|nr:alpha-1,2-fucosyltransferase [bacterium]
MILYVSEGGLGNQIFQYMFLKKLQANELNNEKIIAYGFEEIKEVFDGIDIITIQNPFKSIKRIHKLRKLYYNYNDIIYFIRKLLVYLGERKIISYISTKKIHVGGMKTETPQYEINSGIIKRIIFLEPGFFQGEKFFDRSHLKIKLKENLVKKAQKLLSICPKNSYKVFVHVRLKDYENYRVFGKSVILPTSYYENLINWFKNNRENPFFIFISDDPEKVEKTFRHIDQKLISRNNYAIDFAIMTLCNAGILSPSTFSWWGAFLMQKRDIVFAPRYWLGWKSKIEYPPHILESEIFTKVDVT